MDDRPTQSVSYRRRRRQRRSRAWVALLVLGVAVLVTAGAAFAWSQSVSGRSVASAVQTPETTASQPVQVIPQPIEQAPQASPAPKTEPAPTPFEAQAATASDDAVAAAAVEYPGAPAVEAVSISRLKPKHKYVAITIDDGYGFQPEMLELLQKYDARCTTFLLGSWMASNKSTVRKLDKAGFEIANHTWDHKTLTKLSSAQVRSELTRTQTVITSVTGNQAPYMRPPGGGTNKQVKATCADLGYTTIMWNRTFADSSKHASPENSYHWVMEYGGGVKPGDIILCHWGSKNTLAAMKRILPELKAQGFEFVTVSELIADSEPVSAPSSAKKTTGSSKKP